MNFDEWYRQSPTRLCGPTAEDIARCATVSKLRGRNSDGTEWWDDWCFKHHHWLRDSQPSGEGKS